MPDFRTRLESELSDRVFFDEPLGPRVAFRIGGPADAFVTPTDSDSLAKTLGISREFGVPVTILGSGSNVLISDAGIRGITLRLRGELSDTHVALFEDGKAELEVGAGALNAQLVAFTLRLGLVGIEFLATIPGTFGGALIMNAGAHGGEIGPFVREARLLDSNLVSVKRTNAECKFAYRSSGFARGEILTGAVLEIPFGDVEEAKKHLKIMRETRRKTQPIGLPNAGSIFKNPPGNYAGKLIELCGLKGLREGGAQISELHANFIVNVGGATAKDVVKLADIAKAAVKDRFGIDLEWEVKRIGEGF